ncbi:MAG: zf-HC2 domain-containing protein [Planctomycetes bacterium]|nr:zf-HC2 domain-containing protein [Planctomycetota bacterium]
MFSSDEELISAYLDDELSAEERVRAEQLLTERADLRRLLEELRSVREGLQSLPAYALGDDFSSLVFKRAEREVLKDGADSTSSSTAARATADEPVAPAKPLTGEDRRTHGGNGDYRHSWRPLGWAIAALAAAVVLTVVQRGWIADRRQEVAMNQGAKEEAGVQKPVPRKTAEQKGDLAATAAPASPPAEAMRKEAGPAIADAAKKEENLATADRRAGALGADAMRGLNLPATTATTTPTAAASSAETEGLARRDAPIMTKAGAAPGAAPNDFAGNALPGNAGRNALATDWSQPVAEIAQADFNRAATIVSQLRSLKSESQSARVPAAQLQQRLAVVEEIRLQERSNLAGDLAPQSQAGPQSQAVQTPRPAAKDAAGERAKLGDDKSDGAAVAGRPAEDKQREQTEKRTFAEQQLIPSQLGGNVIVVYVDGTREALDKVLVPTLQQQQIADLNNSWQPQGLALAATNTYTGVLDSIVPPTFVSNVGSPSLAEPSSRQRGDLAKSGTRPADLNGRAGEKKQGEKAADGQQAFSGESSTGGEEEYFYLVCPTDKLEATLSTLKSQPQYVLNLRCEPGPTTPQEEVRWLAYNRDGAYQGGFGRNSGGKLAGESSTSAAVQGPPAAAYSGQTTVSGGGSAATTSPAAPALPHAASSGIAGTDNAGGAMGSTVANGGILIGSAAVAKSSSGTLNLSGAAGGNGFGAPTQVLNNNGVNNFAVDNKLPVAGLALQTQVAQPSRAQRLTSQQVVTLESLAGSQAGRAQAGQSKAIGQQGYGSVTPPQQPQQQFGGVQYGGVQYGGAVPAPAAGNEQVARQVDGVASGSVAKDDGETRSATNRIAGKSNAEADAYKAKSMSEATPPKSGDAPAAASAPAAAPSQAAAVQTAPTGATHAVQQAAPSQMAQQRGVAAVGEGFSLSLSQTSPMLPADYREAIFVFRVVDSPAQEPAVPADAKPETAAPANTSPTPAKPANTTPAVKKAG